ncbi:hypothetical protein [Streptomyces hokutonensis]|uniref:hypothetical protein n=1 Tax=Streptomyces hokutonensis TaxID=1306990 RepID=UPI0036BCF45F
MEVEQVPDIPMFRKNTAAFVHEISGEVFSNVDGDSTYVRVQVLTNAGALDRDKQLAVVRRSYHRAWLVLDLHVERSVGFGAGRW